MLFGKASSVVTLVTGTDMLVHVILGQSITGENAHESHTNDDGVDF